MHHPPSPVPPPSGDIRDRITPDALFVDASLIGLPLARPWRRGAAMAVDGALVALLSALIQAPGVFFGLGATLLLFRLWRGRAPSAGPMRRMGRLAMSATAAAVLVAAARSGFNEARERFGDTVVVGLGEQREVPGVRAGMTGATGVRVAADVLAFRQAPNAVEARVRGERVMSRLERADADGELDALLADIAESAPDRPWLAAVADSLLQERAAAAPARPDPDSLLLAYASALQGGDEGVDGMRRELVASLAADTLSQLGRQLAEARREREALDRRVDELQEAAEESGVVALLTSLLDDLGLTFGWMGLYFTAMLAHWRGQTPGKRLLGIRVVRLNGKPIGWWVAFERFGGYAAGFATGLLGFLQILWDRNRQGIHDKITETAVIQER